MQSFTNSFVLCRTPQSDRHNYRILSEVPRSVDLARQRRAHHKSRAGCESCKKRRVKCDEASPCQNCQRRGERCVRPRAANVLHTKASAQKRTAPQALLPNSNSRYPTISSMSSMIMQTDGVVPKLLHHFQTNTRQTLLFAPEAWDLILQMCSDFDFVLDAVLCVAARHLAVLSHPAGDNSSPSSPACYSTLATHHLCRALSSFRTQLSNSLIAIHPDAFIATSLLLQFEVWADTNCLVSPAQQQQQQQQQQQHTSACCSAFFEPSYDRMFAFCASLKGMFLENFPQEAAEKSALMPYIRHNAANTLAGQVHLDAATLEGYRRFFSRRHVVTLQMMVTDEQPLLLPSNDVVRVRSVKLQHCSPHNAVWVEEEEHDRGYAQVIDQLALILSFLSTECNASDQTQTRSSTRSISPGLMDKLARHILAFPIACRGVFTSLVAENDPHAVLLLCYFYRAVTKLLGSTTFWWAHKRAATLERALKTWLAEKYAI